MYVWSSKHKAFKPKNTVPNGKHGGGIIILRGGFTASVLIECAVDEIIKNRDYLKILQLQLRSISRWLKLGHNYVFQQHNDPKHTSNLVLEQYKLANTILLKWSSQLTSLDEP